MPRISKKIGKKFGRLTVLGTVPRYYSNRRYTSYKCLCDCGNTVETALINAKSCGCLQKEMVSERSKKEFGFAAKNEVWNYYKRNAQTRNLEWSLSKDQFNKLVQDSCFYCNINAEDLWETASGSSFVRSGIDRFDNSKGYTIENCVSCCKICNRAKGSMPGEMFLKWITRLQN